jgi:N-acetylmuramoyl-L-alanine amidase CwlA
LIVKKFVVDSFLLKIIEELEDLWVNRTRHGANRQKFGGWQEQILERLVKKYVPVKHRPDKKERLKIDAKFATYCKAIVWNGQKSLGKKISREKPIRNGVVSLSEFDHFL